jgi:hypothetical protein
MGFILEFRNNRSSKVKYAYNNAGANSSWMSRNMIWSGLAILSFMVLQFIDFWFPEMNTKLFSMIGPVCIMENSDILQSFNISFLMHPE